MASTISFLPITSKVISADNGAPVEFTLTNNSASILSIYWLDRNGLEVPFATILPGQKVVEASMSSHVWEVKSGDGLIGFKFFPETSGDINVTDTANNFQEVTGRIIRTTTDDWSATRGFGLINVATSLGVKDTGAALATSGQNNNLALNLIHAPSAWTAGITGKGVTVAVLDLGIAANAEINSNITGGYDFVDNDTNPQPSAGVNQDHALGLASVIAASHTTRTGQDTQGVAPDASILNVRIGDASGSTLGNIVKGINYAVDNGAKVICLPVQSTLNSAFFATVASAIHNAYVHNVVVVVMGGDFGNVGPSGPGLSALTSSECIDVGNYNSLTALPVDTANLPGTTPFPWVLASSTGYVPTSDGSYATSKDGDSATASAYVAGLAALLFQQSPNATAKQVIDKIILGASLAIVDPLVVAAPVINGTNGPDTLKTTELNDVVNGGAGFDTLVFSGNLANYTLRHSGSTYQVTDNSGKDGIDLITNVESLKFADLTVNLTVQAKAAAAPAADVQRLMELYVAFFNRIPDGDGMAYWIDQLTGGQTTKQIAETFYGVGVQYASLTGFSASMTTADFINVVYKNVLGRPEGADEGGMKYWSDLLVAGTETRGSLVSAILGGAHAYKGDATWGWVANLLDNKIAVAQKFAVDWGLSFATADASITQGMAIAGAISPTDMTEALGLIGVSSVNLIL